MGVKKVSLETLELEESSDDGAVVRGAATLEIQTEDGQTIQASAKFIVFWKRLLNR